MKSNHHLRCNFWKTLSLFSRMQEVEFRFVHLLSFLFLYFFIFFSSLSLHSPDTLSSQTTTCATIEMQLYSTSTAPIDRTSSKVVLLFVTVFVFIKTCGLVVRRVSDIGLAARWRWLLTMLLVDGVVVLLFLLVCVS